MVWIVLSVVALLLVGAIGLLLPPGRSEPAPLRDGEGAVLKGSISEKCFVEINGTSQGMFLKGKDMTKPVLLLLHGGPGMPDYFLAEDRPTELEDEFVVCYWEQRGTGLSYSKELDPDTMTTEQLVADTLAVTDYLRERFGQEKIYLMGHSWGSYLGLNVVAASPERYHAYIAMSQVVDQPESELEAYAYMLGQYKDLGKTGMVRKLEEYPVAESEAALASFSVSLLRDQAMHELGVGTTHDMKSVISGIFLPSLNCRDYTIGERVRIWKGKAFSRSTGLMDEMNGFDARERIPEIDVPIYFFAGFYDKTCSYNLQKEYYERLQAPQKGFYTFSQSAHSPVFEEPELAMKILTEDVLQGRTELRDM